MSAVRVEASDALLLHLLPHRGIELGRWAALASADPLPVVTVVGKFNHGKSRLLNELGAVGHFAVADRRETTTLAEVTAGGVRWLDAPGLDADAHGEDDRLARDACGIAADLRLFVHSAREGEFDGAEIQVLQALAQDAAECGRPSLVVLSQIDQVADAATLSAVQSAALQQISSLPLFPVSAVRHAKGIAEGKTLLVQASGVLALQAAIAAACANVAAQREREVRWLHALLHAELTALAQVRADAAAAAATQRDARRQAFAVGLEAVLCKAAEDVAQLQPVPDNAAFDDPASQFRSGRSLRSKIITGHLLASAKINLALSSYLEAHGAAQLPADPTRTRPGMDTVMVTVLGVSVKFLDDLRRLFGNEEGRQRLQQAFLHYFDHSGQQQELQARYVQLHAASAQVQDAVGKLDHSVHVGPAR